MGCLFRMPLYRYKKLFCSRFKGLDHAVVRYCGKVKPSSGIFYALMVGTSYLNPFDTHDAREEGPFEDIDIMEHLFAGLPGAVLDRFGKLERNVLVEFSTERHVRKLRAAADGQHGFLGFGHCLKKGQLELRARGRGNRHPGVGQRFFLVEPGVYVIAAAEQETVKLSDQIGNGRLNAEDGHRDPSRPQYRFTIVLIEDTEVPCRLDLQVCGDADQRF